MCFIFWRKRLPFIREQEEIILKRMDGIITSKSLYGTGVFATRDFSAGDILFRRPLSEVFYVQYEDLDHYEADLRAVDRAAARNVLEHTIALEDGKVGGWRSPIMYFNHSCFPNTQTVKWSEWVGPGDLALVALRDIRQGEECLIDYNHSSGYDVRTDKPIKRFLSLCDEFGAIKRPSDLRRQIQSDVITPEFVGFYGFEQETRFLSSFLRYFMGKNVSF